MSAQQKYVVGFLFHTDRDQYRWDHPEEARVLLQLQRPGKRYTGGLFNGIGGKIEPGETPNGAMRRGALEEAGIILPEGVRWEPFHYERHSSGSCLHFYVANLKNIPRGDFMFAPTESLPEPCLLNRMNSWDLGRCVPNLRYLLPMADHWIRHPGERYLEG
jgi:8-oxo-dGTP pyrophosphatase MutT (NUDIX family)